MTETPKYNRILLKLSGEAFMGDEGFGVSKDACRDIAVALKDVQDKGVQIGFVPGGGNIFRGGSGASLGLDRTPADHIGMLGTLINGIALRQALHDLGADVRLMSALSLPAVAERFVWHKAMDHLGKGRIVIFAGGTGSPYFTTDTAAALRACEIEADILLKATKVDGVYDKDPNKFDDAKKFSTLSYGELLAQSLGVMDLPAAAMCSDNKIPCYVFNMVPKGSLWQVVSGQNVGTIIT